CPAQRASDLTLASFCAAVCTPVHTAVPALPAPLPMPLTAVAMPPAAALAPFAARLAAPEIPDQTVRTVCTDLTTPSTAVVMTFHVLNAATTPSTASVKFLSVSGDRPASQSVMDTTTSSAPAPGPDMPEKRFMRVVHRFLTTWRTLGAVART